MSLIKSAELELFESASTRVYPDTKNGVISALKGLVTPLYLKKLNFETGKFTPDPFVSGVWKYEDKSGAKFIVYLAGYKDPFHRIRDTNDFEEFGDGASGDHTKYLTNETQIELNLADDLSGFLADQLDGYDFHITNTEADGNNFFAAFTWEHNDGNHGKGNCKGVIEVKDTKILRIKLTDLTGMKISHKVAEKLLK